MKAIKIYYEHIDSAGTWLKKAYVPKDVHDYQRCVDLVHSKPDEYKIITVERIDKEWA
jgi:hypothetical protein